MSLKESKPGMGASIYETGVDDGLVFGPCDLRDYRQVRKLLNMGSAVKHVYRDNPEIQASFASSYSFRLELAARAEIHHLCAAISEQIDAALEIKTNGRQGLDIASQLGGMGPLTGIIISNKDDLRTFAAYFQRIPRIHEEEEILKATNYRVSYGGVFTEMILKRLTEPEPYSLEEQTEAIIAIFKSWRGLLLLPDLIIKQALWRIPNFNQTLFANAPALCQKIAESLKSKAASIEKDHSVSPEGKLAIERIIKELERIVNFAGTMAQSLKELEKEQGEKVKETYLRSFDPLITPLRFLTMESLEGYDDLFSKEAAAAYQNTAQELVDAFLIGRFGLERETVEKLILVAGDRPYVIPWILLELQKRGICEVSDEYYQTFPFETHDWQIHLSQLITLDLITEEVEEINGETEKPLLVSSIHRLLAQRKPPSIKLTKDSIVFVQPGKFYREPHLQHVLMLMTAARVVPRLFGNGAYVMASPNRRDPQPEFSEMPNISPAIRRAQLFRRGLMGCENAFAAVGGQQKLVVSSNKDKFGKDGQDGRLGYFFERAWGVRPKVGVVAGIEKLPLFVKEYLPKLPAVLFPRAQRLVSMLKAIQEMREAFDILDPHPVVIVLLPGLGTAGRRIRLELERKHPDPDKLAAWLHPQILDVLAEAETDPLKKAILLKARGVKEL